MIWQTCTGSTLSSPCQQTSLKWCRHSRIVSILKWMLAMTREAWFKLIYLVVSNPLPNLKLLMDKTSGSVRNVTTFNLRNDTYSSKRVPNFSLFTWSGSNTSNKIMSSERRSLTHLLSSTANWNFKSCLLRQIQALEEAVRKKNWVKSMSYKEWSNTEQMQRTEQWALKEVIL